MSKLFIKKLTENAKIDPPAKNGDAGYDMYSIEDKILEPNIPVKIKTGIAMHIPDNNVGLIWDRSSMGSKGIKTLGGVVDSSYRGEIMVCMINLTRENYEIKSGDKIAQMIFQEYKMFEIEEINDLQESERGENGFGSTGK